MKLGNFIKEISKLLINNPIYPHWLEKRNIDKGKEKLVKLFSGNVLETGSGSDNLKEFALQINPKITRYLATDTNEWDEEFELHSKSSRSLGFITEFLYGKPKDTNKIDQICNALDLPFKNKSFDTYCCFGVLEHVNSPQQLFKEAQRVLKKGGHIYLSTPFMYREHGTPVKDYQRITKGGFYHLAKENGLKVEFIYSNAFFGSMMASFINQYIIRKILEGNILIKISLFLFCPFIFISANILGYFIDILDHDDRFSPIYYVAMKKT